jgi:beta-phosphoglucomutase-like phosphatase (HAD superfamily)
MKVILFGGIGTIVDTSYLQHKAFNMAFKQLAIDWQWSQQEYSQMLVKSGGWDRISNYNEKHGGLPANITAKQVHELKTMIFHELMGTEIVPLRPGVKWVIEQAKDNNILLAFATTTSKNNVDAILNATGLSQGSFNIIGNRSLINLSKPNPDIYEFCLRELGATSRDCIAIEDSGTGLASAQSAKIKCLAFPNEFTKNHDFSGALDVVIDLQKAKQLLALFA